MQRQEKRSDVEKERYWRRAIGEAARSGVSIRRSCQQRQSGENHCYWWQRELPSSQLVGTATGRVGPGYPSAPITAGELLPS